MKSPELVVKWLICLGFAGLLAGELAAGPAPAKPPPLPRDAAAEDVGLPAPPPPALDASTEMVARPLFFASRAPLPPEPAGAALPPPRAPDLSLLGTVLSLDGRVAVVRPARQAKPLQLTVGQTVEGWIVAEIAEDRLVLRLGETSLAVPLPEIGVRRTPPSPVTIPLAPPAPRATEPVARPPVPLVESRPLRPREPAGPRP